MNECEHVIVLDVCFTIKRPTTMCLAKKKKKETFLHASSGYSAELGSLQVRVDLTQASEGAANVETQPDHVLADA